MAEQKIAQPLERCKSKTRSASVKKWWDEHPEEKIRRGAKSKKALVEIICLNCGKSFKVKPGMVKRRKCCSHKCSSAFKKGQRYSRKTEFKRQISVTEENLLDLYWVKNKSYTEICRLLGCSPGGLWKVFSRYEIARRPNFSDPNFEFPIGKDHPNWRGGYEPYYGANWRRQRRKALERDGYRCQECGSCTALCVHHKRPLMTFEVREEANTLDNLLVLCTSCHSKIEWLNRKQITGSETTMVANRIQNVIKELNLQF